MSSVAYQKDFVAVGPWGGHGGSYWDDDVQASVRKIFIAYGAGVVSLQFQYVDNEGGMFWSKKHGGDGGDKTRKVKLNYPEEYLIAMRGFYGLVGTPENTVCVRSISFVSNMRTYGPFGVGDGAPFTFQMAEGQKIVGFYGRSSGQYIDSIGAYVKHKISQNNALDGQSPQSFEITSDPLKFEYSVVEGSMAYKFDVLISNSSTDNSLPATNSKQILDSDISDLVHKQKEPEAFGEIVALGPWGDSIVEKNFDDGKLFTGIKEIIVSVDNTFFRGLSVLYEQDGSTVWRHHHLNNASLALKTYNIKLDYPNEILTQISGYYTNFVTSLTFHTTKQKYGPYGVESGGTPFSSSSKKGAIVGFFGDIEFYVYSIGVYFKEGKVTIPPASTTTSSTR